MLIAFFRVHASGKGTGTGRSLHKRDLEIPHITSAHILLARPRSYGHNQMRWKTLIRAAICSAEDLGEGENAFSRQLAVAAEEYDFMILFRRNLEY